MMLETVRDFNKANRCKIVIYKSAALLYTSRESDIDSDRGSLQYMIKVESQIM